jgi:hypothetical protein
MSVRAVWGSSRRFATASSFVVTVTLQPCGNIIDHGIEGSMHREKHGVGAL